jgi:hypothetical protein
MSILPEEARTIAEEAYIYAYPMLQNYRSIFGLALYPASPGYRAPLNQMKSDAFLLGPDFKAVVSPNNDTPYSMAVLDLRAEPMMLSVPEIPDKRYYSFQLIDLYTHNFDYIGSRSTGFGAGSYLIAGPNWEGDKPEGIEKVIKSETDLVFTVGRTQLLGPDDMPNVVAIQEGYKLETLSQFLGEEAPPPPEEVEFPVWDEDGAHSPGFIGYLNFLIDWVKPHPSEAEMMERFGRIGIGPGRPFDPEEISPDILAAIEEGIKSGRSKIEEAVDNIAENVNGWLMTDCFGTREYMGGDYTLRAAGAMGGLYGNTKIEAFYPTTQFDKDGERLDTSKHKYVVRFESGQLPPAKAFWSLTIYDTSYDGKAGFFVANPIDRYLINASTPGLKYGEDGSLEIYIQRDRPEGEKESNWLPGPDMPCYLIMRIYWPEQAALDGTWEPPPVKKVD